MNGIVGMPTGKRYLLDRKDKIISTIKNRFYAKVLLPNDNGCMEWIGSLSPIGYGGFLVKSKSIIAHRFSYEMHIGKIPKGLHVLHKCDNRRCVAPDHLWLGTHKDNMKDMGDKNRRAHLSGENASNVKLTELCVRDIKNKLAKGQTHISIAKEYGVDKTTITAINLKRNWRHII